MCKDLPLFLICDPLIRSFRLILPSIPYYSLVCPTCVMFHNHRKHDVIPPEDAVRNIRDQFDKNIKSGLLSLLVINSRQAQGGKHWNDFGWDQTSSSPMWPIEKQDFEGGGSHNDWADSGDEGQKELGYLADRRLLQRRKGQNCAAGIEMEVKISNSFFLKISRVLTYLERDKKFVKICLEWAPKATLTKKYC